MPKLMSYIWKNAHKKWNFLETIIIINMCLAALNMQTTVNADYDQW